MALNSIKQLYLGIIILILYHLDRWDLFFAIRIILFHNLRIREYSFTIFIFIPRQQNGILKYLKKMMNFSLQPFPLPNVRKLERVRHRQFSLRAYVRHTIAQLVTRIDIFERHWWKFKKKCRTSIAFRWWEKL